MTPAGVTASAPATGVLRLARFFLGPGQRRAAEALAEQLVPRIQAQPGLLYVAFFGDPRVGDYGLAAHWATEGHAEDAAAVLGPLLQKGLAAHAQGPADIRLHEVLRSSAPLRGLKA